MAGNGGVIGPLNATPSSGTFKLPAQQQARGDAKWAPGEWEYLSLAFDSTVGNASLSNSNRTYSNTGSAGAAWTTAITFASDGKYYWEGHSSTTYGISSMFGLSETTGSGYAGDTGGIYDNAAAAGGLLVNQGFGSGGWPNTAFLDESGAGVNLKNSVIGFALDVAAGKYWLSWKGIWNNAGGPLNDSSPCSDGLDAARLSGRFFRAGNHSSSDPSNFQLLTMTESSYFNYGNLMNNW